MKRPHAVAVGRETVARVTFGLLAQVLDLDPELLVEDELELARQGGSSLSLLRIEAPQIEVLGGPLVVSPHRRRQKTPHGGPRYAAVVLIGRPGRLLHLGRGLAGGLLLGARNGATREAGEHTEPHAQLRLETQTSPRHERLPPRPFRTRTCCAERDYIGKHAA